MTKRGIAKQCQDCGITYSAYTSRQKYCSPCGEKNGRRIKLDSYYRNADENRVKTNARSTQRYRITRSPIVEKGVQISKGNRGSFNSSEVHLEWVVGINPFTSALSKNAVWRTNNKGYVYNRRKSTDARRQMVL